MKDNGVKGIIFILLAALLAGVGYCIYKVIKFQEELVTAQVASSEKSILPEKEEECKIIEKVITRENPWGSLQPKLKDTVVQVYNQIGAFNWLEPYKTPEQGVATGTGFFIDDKGHIITNAHVVNETKSLKIQIPSLGKRQLNVEVVGVSPDRDLALLKLQENEAEDVRKILGKIPYLNLGDSDKVKRASEVMALGYPLGQQSLKSTTGVVSGRESMSGRQYIQIDAAINPGNSGGPSLDPDGNVIGINTAGVTSAQNVGYIIPINELKLVLNGLFSAPNKLLRKPFLGIFYNTGSSVLTEYLGNPQPGGVYITNTFPGSVLEKAGIKQGDMIYELNGHKVDIYGDISSIWSEDKISIVDYVSFIPLDSTVSMTIYRKGTKKTFNFKFEESKLPAIRVMYPDYEKIDYEVVGGMVVMELSRNLLPHLIASAPAELIKYEEPKNQIEPVLVITHILPDSAAQNCRVLAAGIRIAEINGVKVTNLTEFRDSIRKSVKTDYLTVKTHNDIFAAFRFKELLKNEFRLSGIYRFPVSKVIEALSKEVLGEQEDAARSVAATTTFAS